MDSVLTKTAFILKSIKFFTSAVSSRNNIIPFLRITSPSKSLYFCKAKDNKHDMRERKKLQIKQQNSQHTNNYANLIHFLH